MPHDLPPRLHGDREPARSRAAASPAVDGRRGPSHSWQRSGGGATVAASILLAVSTWLEYLVLGPGAPAVVFVLFVVAFGASTLLFGGAAFAVARFGIVGASLGGRLALRAYGLCWIVSQAAYLTYKYALPPATSNFYFVLLSTGFLALTFVFGFVAAIFIASGRIAWGAARWSLFVAIGVSAGCGLVISSTDSLVLISVMETVSALVQAFVGLTYYFAPGRDRWIRS